MSGKIREPYSTDLADDEWAIIEPLLPEAIWHPHLQKPKHTRREILNAILYVNRTGCQWRALPHDFPPWKTVFNTFNGWKKKGLIRELNDALRDRVRLAAGRQTAPTLGILDSQSVKTTEVAHSSGYDAGKKVKGRKRHVIVDVLGLVLVAIVTVASVQDRDGAVPAIAAASASFPTLRKILVDNAYKGKVIDQVSQETKIAVEVVSREEKIRGFSPVFKRWIGERTFGWFGRYRRQSKDYERYEDTGVAMIHTSMIGLMLRRLTVG